MKRSRSIRVYKNNMVETLAYCISLWVFLIPLNFPSTISALDDGNNYLPLLARSDHSLPPCHRLVYHYNEKLATMLLPIHVELANNIMTPSEATKEFATLITAHFSDHSVIRSTSWVHVMMGTTIYPSSQEATVPCHSATDWSIINEELVSLVLSVHVELAKNIATPSKAAEEFATLIMHYNTVIHVRSTSLPTPSTTQHRERTTVRLSKRPATIKNKLR